MDLKQSQGLGGQVTRCAHGVEIAQCPYCAANRWIAPPANQAATSAEPLSYISLDPAPPVATNTTIRHGISLGWSLGIGFWLAGLTISIVPIIVILLIVLAIVPQLLAQ